MEASGEPCWEDLDRLGFYHHIVKLFDCIDSSPQTDGPALFSRVRRFYGEFTDSVSHLRLPRRFNSSISKESAV